MRLMHLALAASMMTFACLATDDAAASGSSTDTPSTDETNTEAADLGVNADAEPASDDAGVGDGSEDDSEGGDGEDGEDGEDGDTDGDTDGE